MFAVSLFTAACQKDHFREILEGKWDYTQNKSHFINGVLDFSSSVEAGTIQFNANGTGEKDLGSDGKRRLQWWANSENVYVKEEFQSISGPVWWEWGECAVSDPTAKEQIWSYEHSYGLIDSVGNIIPHTTKVKVNLKKK